MNFFYNKNTLFLKFNKVSEWKRRKGREKKMEDGFMMFISVKIKWNIKLKM